MIKTTENIGPDNLSNAVQYQQDQKKQYIFAQQRVYKGHKMHEINTITKVIKVVTPEKIAVHTPGAPLGPITTKRKLITQPNCLYISCLNIKNLKRLIDAASVTDISDYNFLYADGTTEAIKDLL